MPVVLRPATGLVVRPVPGQVPLVPAVLLRELALRMAVLLVRGLAALVPVVLRRERLRLAHTGLLPCLPVRVVPRQAREPPAVVPQVR